MSIEDEQIRFSKSVTSAISSLVDEQKILKKHFKTLLFWSTFQAIVIGYLLIMGW